MTIINSLINHDKCHLSVKYQNMEYHFSFSLDRSNTHKIQQIIQKFRSLSQALANYEPGNHEDDEEEEPSNIVFVSYISDHNTVYSLIEHSCEDDYSLGYLRFEQRIDMAEQQNFSESSFFLEITEENRNSIVSNLQRISNEIENYMRRETRPLPFGFGFHQGMSFSSSPQQPSSPMTPQQPSSPMASRQMYQTPTASSPQQPSAPMASRQMSHQPMTPQQLFVSSPVYQTPTASSPQQPSAPMFNRYPQGMSSSPLFREN